MDIRKLEDELFNSWSKNNAASTFTIDGCPNPKVYSSESRKFVFVLKDSNLGKDYSEPLYYLRHELETKPHLWWKTIASWCYFLQDSNASWLEVRNKISTHDSIKEVLGHYCFMQLKKESGGGGVSYSELREAVETDKHQIIKQLTIYSPDYVIACGTGDLLSAVFDGNHYETNSGVGYWKIEIGGKSSCLIDYCHPSIRAGAKIRGLIAQGLSKAVSEIETSLTRSV